MKFNLRTLALTVGLCFLSRPIHGAGRYLEVEYPPSTATHQLQIGVTYTMWIPDDVARFRCVIVHQHGAGRTALEKGSTAAYDLHWQALAKKWDCALLGPSYHVLTDATTLRPEDRSSGSIRGVARIKPSSRHSAILGAGEASGACDCAVGSMGTFGRRHLVRRDDDPASGPRGCRVPAIRLVPEPARLPAARDAGRRLRGPRHGERRRERAGPRRMDHHSREGPRISQQGRPGRICSRSTHGP